MPVMVKNEAAVLFVHIPKCGGSSFEKGMEYRGWRELLSIRGMGAAQLKFMRCSPQHMHAELLTRVVRPERFDMVVTIVRNPLSRLRSEYSWQHSQNITKLAPDQWIAHVFEAFDEDPYAYDNHIRPQNEFLLHMTKIFKLEEDGVTRALHSVAPDASKNSMLSFLLGRSRTPGRRKARTQTPEIHRAFALNKDKIVDFYRRDYEVLGYPLPEVCSSDLCDELLEHGSRRA